MPTNTSREKTLAFLDGAQGHPKTMVGSLRLPPEQRDERTIQTRSGTFIVNDSGVFHSNLEEGSKEWLSSRIDVLSQSRNMASKSWGRVLRWSDADGTVHQLAVPAQWLHGDGVELIRCLAAGGLALTRVRKWREKFLEYLQFAEPTARARCVNQLGWHGERYLTPAGVIGDDNECLIFQDDSMPDTGMEICGSSEEWRQTVSAHARGNSRLMFSIAAALAGPLLNLIGEDSGGFHLVGQSSSGKSRCLQAAASVWGHPDRYKASWRVTVNGLEGLALSRNDNILILDEMGQCNPADVGEAAYMLANGQGKVRGNTGRFARAIEQWRVMILSSGEISLANHMASDGRAMRVGQEIRLANIDADAGAGHRVFENIHGHSSASAFADQIKHDCEKAHGMVGQEWVHRLVGNHACLLKDLSDRVSQVVTSMAPDGGGQVMRVARRFALVAVAGEFASEYGLTGWQSGESTRSATKCFQSWVAKFGSGEDREVQQVLEQVADFFAKHGASRFQVTGCNGPEIGKIANRAGYAKDVLMSGKKQHQRQYMVSGGVYKDEICKGHEPGFVTKVLIDRGWLVRASDNKGTHNKYIASERRNRRLYVFAPGCFDEEGEAMEN